MRPLFPVQLPTPEGWKIIGYLLLAFSLFCVAVGVYGGLKKGFDFPSVKLVIGGGVVLGGLTLSIWYAVHRYIWG